MKADLFLPKSFFVLILLLIINHPLLLAQGIKHESVGLYDDYLLDNNNADDYSGGYYVNAKPDSTKRQSPTAALFKSLFIPGWGQLGNHQYIEAGVAIGLESVLIGAVIHHEKKTVDAKRLFDEANSAGIDTALIQSRFDVYDNARDKRNRYLWYTGAVIFISMFDAYVGAHLASFPKQDKELSLKIMPDRNEDVRVVLALSI